MTRWAASHMYILLTVAFTVYGQLVLKWQVEVAGAMPAAPGERVAFLFGLVFNPWVISGFLAAFLAALCWMMALSRFELSYAYPFMSLSFVLVFVAGAWLFQEPVTAQKGIAMALIMAGIVIMGRG